MDLSQEQVLAQLRTRGFEEGFQATPLRDFWGNLTDFAGQMRDGQRGPYLVVLYNFNNLEVIETNEPYTNPIAQIEISHSSRAKSRMGYFGASVDRVINAGVPPEVPQEQTKNQSYLIGKRCHMRYTPGHMVWNQEAKEERPVDCWELVEVQGEATPAPAAATVPGVVAPPPAAGPTAAQQALALLDGKTEQQWHQAVFVDPIVKGDSTIINDIIGRKFLAPLEAAGMVAKDESGVYHVKAT